MTDNEINIAIAKACGWTKFMLGTCVPPGHEKDWSDYVSPLPNYTTDLNAMHEAEKVIDQQGANGKWQPPKENEK